MKIVCLTHYYIQANRAGGELMVHHILKYLAKQGHDVTAVITRTELPDTVIDGVKVIYREFNRLHFDSLKPDLIISQFENSNCAIRYAHRNHIPVCIVVHNDMDYTQEVVRSLHTRDFVIFNTKWLQVKFRTPCRSMVLHPPIDVCNSKPKPEEQKYVTLVNLVREKGSEIFYRLALNMPDVEFLAVQGGYWKERQMCLSIPNVTLIPNTSDMFRDVYSKSKLILMPSTYESYGMVAAEAIHYGIPVLCSPLPGLIENLDSAGIYLDGNWKNWREEIYALLNNDEQYHIRAHACSLQSETKQEDAELYTLNQVIEGLTCQ